VRPYTVRRPRLALGDGAATRVSFFGSRAGVSFRTYVLLTKVTNELPHMVESLTGETNSILNIVLRAGEGGGGKG